MAVTVADVLALPLMAEAEVVAGHAHLADQQVRWAAVIEWPVETFVASGELILTSGVGCDEPMFESLCEQTMDAGAAAIFVGTGASRYVESTSVSTRAMAEARGVPLVEIPWDVRFAEIMQSIVNALLADQYADMDKTDTIHRRFTSLIIDGMGLETVAETLEDAISRPVLIFDAEFRLQATGNLAAETVGPIDLDQASVAAAALTTQQITTLAGRLDDLTPTELEAVPELSLGPAASIPVVSKRCTLGYIFALSPNDRNVRMPALESRAMQHAATAAALDMMRVRAVADAESRVRGDFLWTLAWGLGGLDEDMEARAAALGYNARGTYWVAVIREPGKVLSDRTGEDLIDHQIRTQRDLGASGRQIGVSLTTAAHDDLILVLVPAWLSDEDLPRRFADLLRSRQPHLSAAVASSAVPFSDLHKAYREARRALDVAQAVLGEPCVVHSSDLDSYLLLEGLAADETAQQICSRALSPLIDYDDRSGKLLLRTLEVYLDEGCNASGAARELFLNRHSLLYRLAKIEELTGYQLSRRDDKFILEASLRLFRLAGSTSH
jgi:purine catabolism regulator